MISLAVSAQSLKLYCLTVGVVLNQTGGFASQKTFVSHSGRFKDCFGRSTRKPITFTLNLFNEFDVIVVKPLGPFTVRFRVAEWEIKLFTTVHRKVTLTSQLSQPLEGEQLGVEARALSEVSVAPSFFNPAIFHHENQVG